MEIILTQAVPSLGKEGDVVRVARGYANNYLVPQGLAVPATPGSLKQLEQKRAVIARREAQARAEAQAFADKLNGKTVEIKAKAGAEGRLFGSVTARDIADAIKSQLRVEVDRRKIDLAEHIKEAGAREVSISVYPEVQATVTVNVVAEAPEAGELGSLEESPEAAGTEETPAPETEETGGE